MQLPHCVLFQIGQCAASASATTTTVAAAAQRRPRSSLLLLNVLQKPREAAVEAAVSMCVEGGR